MTTTIPETVRAVLAAAQAGVADGLTAADDLSSGNPDTPRPLLDAAVLAGAALGSVHAAAEFTRARPRPRPVPGVTSATQDPLSQALLGEALADAQGAVAFVLETADELAERPAGPGARALAAFDVAAEAGLRQAERIWEIVGTSGSPNVHGFDRLWREARALTLRHPRGPRRRAVGLAYLGLES
jgi:alkylation response protein AidB-like acyl-CoA dehydrogenase